VNLEGEENILDLFQEGPGTGAIEGDAWVIATC
jgi:hypothetical protein